MKVHVRAKLIEITEWSRDQRKIDSDVGLARGSLITQRILKQQVKERLEDHTFKPRGLPFECEFDADPVEGYTEREDEVKDRLLGEYTAKFLDGINFVVPTDCEFEYEELK